MASDIVKRSQWVDLCPDLLDEIAKHVPSSLDYVSLRAACKSWNTALPEISRHIRGPWLVLPFDDETLRAEKKEPYHLRMPELRDTPIRGSCFGWLITVGIDGELRVLNPFTSSHFLLPPLSTFPGVVSYQPDNHGHEYTIDHRGSSIHTVDSTHMQRDFIAKIILSSSPEEEEEDLMAVAIYGEYPPMLAFYRSGDDKWTDIDFPSSPGWFGFQDAIFHQGKIYAVDRNEYFHEIDVNTLSCGVGDVRQGRFINQMRYKIKYPDGRLLTECDDMLHNKYLVRSSDGHLLMVVRRFCHSSKACRFKTTRFCIFKLDESTKRWNKEFLLGDYVLVIGYNSSIWVPPFQDEEGNCVSNCIYYTDNLPRRELDGGHNFRGQDIGVFSLEDGSINRLFPRSIFPRSPVWL